MAAAKVEESNNLDLDGLFKDYVLHKVNLVSWEIEDMDAISLNYWLTKLMEVAKDSGGRCME